MDITYYLNFRHYGLSNNTQYFSGGVELKKSNEILELSADIVCAGVPYDYARVLSSEPSLCVDVHLENNIDGALSRVQFNPFWSKPSFEKDLSKLSDNIQNVLIKQGNKYIAVLPLCSEDFDACVSASNDKKTLRINVSKYYDGARNLKGVFCIIAHSNNPYDAIRKSYAYAVKNGYIKAPLRSEKQLPEIYKKPGWCSWNAFYHDVTEQGIIDKMKEFQEKKIPIKWIMIDDGWSEISESNNFKIISFFEDRKKFPSGLKGCIEKLKRDYGIEQVGVWHSLTGYWYGIEHESMMHKESISNVLTTNSDLIIPKNYDFFDRWHSYLKEQGVDFVKIDTQGNTAEFLKGIKNCVKLCIDIQQAADKSVMKHFGGNVINCMGMSNLNSHSRPYTVLSRSSDDFFPDKENSFESHIMQNVYNAVFQSNLYFCDFDMWWTNHETAEISAILRIISGGPVYISDKVGDTKAESIMPLLDENGELKMCSDVALPTEDCLFGHDGVLKVFNRRNGKKVIAAFNLTNSPQNVNISEKDKVINSFVLDGMCARLVEPD